MTTWLIPCTIAMRRAKEPMRGKPRKLTTSPAEKRPIDRHRPRVVAWSASPVGPQLKPGQLVMGRFRPSCLSCYNPEIKHCNWESPILEDFTIKTSINWGFSTATFDYQRVYVLLICQSFFFTWRKEKASKIQSDWFEHAPRCWAQNRLSAISPKPPPLAQAAAKAKAAKASSGLIGTSSLASPSWSSWGEGIRKLKWCIFI